MTPSGEYSTLYAFTGYYPDGYLPLAGLLIDQQGNLYGTTLQGGTTDDGGIIFEISPTGNETILHNFDCYSEGCNPQAGLSVDSQGNFYGTTTYSGAFSYGAAHINFSPLTGAMTTIFTDFTGGYTLCPRIGFSTMLAIYTAQPNMLAPVRLAMERSLKSLHRAP